MSPNFAKSKFGLEDAYSYPEYCDVAYDWDRKPECDFIESCIERYSEVKARSILDIACGTGIHLREFARRGYEVVGIDGKKEMVDFVLRQAAAEGLDVKCLRSDIKAFDPGRKFGCVICMLDSFRYLLTDEDILSHLKSVAASLEDGGLYIIDLWTPSGINDFVWEDVSWSERRGDIQVDARYIQHAETFDPKRRTFDDELIFKVTSPSFNSTITSRARTRALLFDEFCGLADRNGSFGRKGKFYNFDFKSKGDYNIKSLRTNLVLKKRR